MHFITLFGGLCALAIAGSVTAAPSAAAAKLTCKTLNLKKSKKAATLSLSRGKVSYNAAFIDGYDLYTAQGYIPFLPTPDPQILTAYGETPASPFVFQACSSSGGKSYVQHPRKEVVAGKDVYYGHLVDVRSKGCVGLQVVDSEKKFLASLNCSSVDDAAEQGNGKYWAATDDGEGTLSLRLVEAKGVKFPSYSFYAGNQTRPALGVTAEKIKGGAWSLTL